MDKENALMRFSRHSEVWHGRLAMIGFAMIAVDLLTGNGVLHHWSLM